MKDKVAENKKELLLLISSILLVMVLITEALPFLTSDTVIDWVKSIHPFGPLFIVLLTAISQIFAPLPGSPGVAISFAIFGWGPTRLYIFFGSMLSATVNYFVANKLGRKWVKRLAGKKSLNQIDEFAQVKGTEVLIISRLIGMPLFDYVSYAAGFTNISFKRYFLITFFFGGIAHFSVSHLYRNVDFTSKGGFLTWYGSFLILFPVLGLLIKKYINWKKKNEEKNS